MRKLLLLFFISIFGMYHFSLCENYESYKNDGQNLANSGIHTALSDLESKLRELQGKIQQLEYAHKQLVAKISNVVDDKLIELFF